jgi:hypothetical protein
VVEWHPKEVRLMPWYVTHPNPQVPRFRILYAVSSPPGAVVECVGYGEAVTAERALGKRMVAESNEEQSHVESEPGL